MHMWFMWSYWWLVFPAMSGLFNANDFVICFGAISWNWTIPSGRFV